MGGILQSFNILMVLAATGIVAILLISGLTKWNLFSNILASKHWWTLSVVSILIGLFIFLIIPPLRNMLFSWINNINFQ